MCRRTLAALLLVTLAGPAQTQVDWVRRQPGNQPTARGQHALAADTNRGEVVLFGGIDAAGPTDDTWIWDGNTWTPRSPAARPSPRAGHAMAFDELRGRVVLFGGGAFLPDTWEWDGATWTRVATSGPPGRTGHAMAYDPRRRCVVLFGGFLGPTFGWGADTWEWDGTTWTQRTTATLPAARQDHALAFDGTGVVLFGGAISTTLFPGTWRFDGSDWQLLTPTATPAGRFDHAMTFDPRRQRVVLFGGSTATGLFGTDETWEWEGADWIARNPSARPGARRAHAIAWDRRAQRTVAFGGLQLASFDDTFDYGPDTPADHTPFGTGCPGTAGTPELIQPAPTDLPWVGEKYTLAVRNIPPGNNHVFGFLGFSSTQWQGVPLPLDLIFFGLPNCWLQTSIDATMPLPINGNQAEWTLLIPNRPTLIGQAFYQQAFILDPPVIATISNATKAAIGSK